MTALLGIRVTVQRDQYASCDELTVVGWIDETHLTGKGPASTAAERVQPMPADLQRAAATDDAPAMWLIARRLTLGGFGSGEPFYVLEPATAIGEPRPWYMAGGNFAAGDAAWEALTTGEDNGRVKILDRVES